MGGGIGRDAVLRGAVLGGTTVYNHCPPGTHFCQESIERGKSIEVVTGTPLLVPTTRLDLRLYQLSKNNGLRIRTKQRLNYIYTCMKLEVAIYYLK